MDYKQKYFKYKNKYISLKIDQTWSSNSSYSLDPKGWKHNIGCKIAEGNPQLDNDSDDGDAFFKHSQTLNDVDVLKMRVTGWDDASVGFVTEQYNVEKQSIAGVTLSIGSAYIHSDISNDGKTHLSYHLYSHILDTFPLWRCPSN